MGAHGGGEVPASGVAAPTWSLRREWSRAFAVLLVLLLLAAVISVAGVHTLMGQLQASARELERETVMVHTLRRDVVAHEQVAQQLMSHDAVDRIDFVEQQAVIDRQFAAAQVALGDHPGLGERVAGARRGWETGLRNYGLWGTQAFEMHGDHTAEVRFFAASSDSVRAQLDDLERPLLDATNQRLARGTDFERGLVGGLVGMFALALGVTGYFRRRMARDLMRPVARLRQGVADLKAGRYGTRIQVSRRDELGELAEAFNEMAAALDQQHQALHHRATYDSLTGLANRATLSERLNAAFTHGGERRAQRETLLFIDIDDFKNVNDSLGHEGGDHLLSQLAERITACVRSGDLVARLGGDEFAVVVMEDGGGLIAVDVAERILRALSVPFALGGRQVPVAVSIGVAPRRPETADAAELLRQADFAMYMAKGAGKNQYKLFDARMHDEMVGTTSLKAELAAVVGTDQLRLAYQPIVDLPTGRLSGVEALIRWDHPRLGYLGPGDFVPLAEEIGVIDQLGLWVLRTGERQLAQWRRDYPAAADLWMSVNVSALQLTDPASAAQIEAVLADPEVDATRLVIEVTETAPATDTSGAVAALERFRALGARVAIDDFGTGFSSLSTLARLPVDLLKIDRSFVSGPTTKEPSRPVLEGIHVLAERLSLPLIAEGIETVDQRGLLQDLRYHLGQGFLFSRPLTAAAVAERLAAADGDRAQFPAPRTGRAAVSP